MKYLNKLFVNFVVALIVGVLFASNIDIAYPCDPGPHAGCVVFESAIFHPRDLINNEQDSLVRFFEVFVPVSLATFAILSVFTYLRKKSQGPRA